MSDFTPERRRALLAALARIDERIDAARERIRARDYAGAAELFAEAIAEKHDRALTQVPDFLDDELVDCPFYPVYDLFSGMDALAHRARSRVRLHEHIPPGVLTPGEFAARLQNMLEELERMLVNRFTFREDGLEEILDAMRAKLRAMIDALRRFAAGQAIDLSVFDGLADLKRRFLQTVNDRVPLWDIYVLLVEIDGHLDGAHGGCSRWAGESPPPPVTSRKVLQQLALLETLEALKHKLQALIEGVALPPPPPPPPADPQPPLLPEIPPGPEYPPGSEDLPPFPPEHASRPEQTTQGLAKRRRRRPSPDR